MKGRRPPLGPEHRRGALPESEGELRVGLTRTAGQRYRVRYIDPDGKERSTSFPDRQKKTAMFIRRYTRDAVSWCVLATDGAQRDLDHLDVPWADLATATNVDLQRTLDDLHRWEVDSDPQGTLLPRAKRHDDKTLVVWHAG